MKEYNYSITSLYECIKDYAGDYIIKKNLSQEDREKVETILVQYIDSMPYFRKLSLKVGVKDLDIHGNPNLLIDSKIILKMLIDTLAYDMSNSSVKDDDFNILLEFINYIVSENNIDKVFTPLDLINYSKEVAHKEELLQLRTFLEDVGKFSKRLKTGENIDTIYNSFEHVSFCDLCAMTYAYLKTDFSNKEKTKNPIILSKIKEMKQK